MNLLAHVVIVVLLAITCRVDGGYLWMICAT